MRKIRASVLDMLRLNANADQLSALARSGVVIEGAEHEAPAHPIEAKKDHTALWDRVVDRVNASRGFKD